IRTVAKFGGGGERRADRIGVWVRRPDKGAACEDKIAAIGIRIKRWVTLHGVALNIDCDLSHYAGIVPCGVSDPRYGLTSLADLGRAVMLTEIDVALRREFEQLFGPVARGQAAADSLVASLPAMRGRPASPPPTPRPAQTRRQPRDPRPAARRQLGGRPPPLVGAAAARPGRPAAKAPAPRPPPPRRPRQHRLDAAVPPV